MYGLILRALQGYVCSTFGHAYWAGAMASSGVPTERFEPLLAYDSEVLRKVLLGLAHVLARPMDAVLEDMGTHIIAGDVNSPLRRLLRFGGSTYEDFLLSLEELPDRARLALPDLNFPRLRLSEKEPGIFRLSCRTEMTELGSVLVGVLRAMADEYGALVVIEPEGLAQGKVSLTISLLEVSFSEGKRFSLCAAQQ